MLGRDFFAVAHLVAGGGTEACWHAAAIHAYYGLFLESRETLERWGLKAPRGGSVHTWVRLRFLYSTDSLLNMLAEKLDELQRLRNAASYELRRNPQLSAVGHAHKAIRAAEEAVAWLDSIEADPARRAAAVASIRP